METLRNIAKSLSRYPAVKRFFKYCYQLIAFAFNFHANKVLSKFQVEKITGENGGFFGYYDKSPESPDGRYIAFHSFSSGKSEKFIDEVEIVVLENATGKKEVVYKTRTFNLQIGSRLQWIDNDNLIFNIVNDGFGELSSVVFTLSSKKVRQLNCPVFDTSHENFVTLNFNNLTSVGSEYGYPLIANEKADTDPYIRFGSINSNTSEEIITMQMVLKEYSHILQNTNDHHFNHLMFSPSGDKIIFILRWTGNSGRCEFLFLYDIVSKKLKIINSEMTSHCSWINDNRILGYMSHLGQSGYFYIDLPTGRFERVVVDKNNGDGHPTSKNDMILTDSYPDKSRMQHLIIISNHKVLHVGSFFSPLVYNEKFRCDLHPRFNSRGDTIYFDSKHEGKRHLYRIKIKSDAGN